jgi:hypothetical protein
LEGFGNEFRVLIRRMSAIDPYFKSLTELRAELAALFADYFS